MKFHWLLLLLFSFAMTTSAIALAETDAVDGLPTIAEEIPDDWEEQIDEKTKDLPEGIRDKIREKMKEAIRARLSAQEEETEDESDDEEKSEDKKDDKEKKEKKEKSPEDMMSEEAKKLKAEIELMSTKFKHQVALYEKKIEAQRLENEKSKIDAKLESERIERQMAALKRESSRMKMEIELTKGRSALQQAQLAAKLAEMKAEKDQLEANLSIETAREKMEDRVLGDEEFPMEPFNDGVLRVSPRRIELNGPIMTGAADYICQRIHYFNNKSTTQPIFIVIDSSPGGSVMEGFQIVQAMQNSKAPIHVVVKRFAASMAACITTLADRSYCYPNAVILHHQASTMMFGNGRSIKDQMRQLEEISERLLGPVAAKQGMTLEEFVDLMYENRAQADWDVFGQEAVERKWVDHLVHEIREEGIRQRPTGTRMPRIFTIFGEHPEPTGYLERYEVQLKEEIDEKGQRYTRLPRLSPIDAWLIYNPDNYYR